MPPPLASSWPPSPTPFSIDWAQLPILRSFQRWQRVAWSNFRANKLGLVMGERQWALKQALNLESPSQTPVSLSPPRCSPV